MSKRKFYTDKDFNRQFPEPGVPADDAWKQMHELLVKNDLTTPVKKDKRRRLVLFFILLCLLTGTSVIYIFTAQNNTGKMITTKSSNTASENNTGESNLNNSDSTPDKIAQQPFIDTLLNQQESLLSNTNKLAVKEQQQNMLPNALSKSNSNNSINDYLPFNKPADKISQQPTEANKIADETPALLTAKPADENVAENSIEKNSNEDKFSLKKAANKSQKPDKFHFGLEWSINFSTDNNSHYFDSYNGGKQYYMWLLPSAWAKMDIGKKHGIALHFNPYNQQFAGRQIVHIEKPMIASIEPDAVTRLIKSRGYNLGIDYEYMASNKLTIAAGINYTVQNKALYAQQEIIAFSGEIASDSIKTAGKNDASFKYLKPAYLSWDASVKYNFRKISIGAGVTKPITDLSSNPDFSVRPLNGRVYLQYRIK